MDTPDDAPVSPLPRLTGKESYGAWNVAVCRLLEAEGLSAMLTGLAPPPDAVPGSPALAVFRRKMRRVWLLMRASVRAVEPQLQAAGLGPWPPAPALLVVLARLLFGPHSDASAVQLWRQWADLKRAHFVRAGDFCTAFVRLARQLDATALALTDAQKTVAFLLNVAADVPVLAHRLLDQFQAEGLAFEPMLHLVDEAFRREGLVAFMADGGPPSVPSFSSDDRAFVAKQSLYRDLFPGEQECLGCLCQHPAAWAFCPACQLCHQDGDDCLAFPPAGPAALSTGSTSSTAQPDGVAAPGEAELLDGRPLALLSLAEHLHEGVFRLVVRTSACQHCSSFAPARTPLALSEIDQAITALQLLRYKAATEPADEGL